MPLRRPAVGRLKKKDYIPLATNILKLQRYNFNFFSTEEILIFEYLIVKQISFKKRFYLSSAKIEEETGIKKSKLKTILTRFARMKIVFIKVDGMPKVKWFTIDFKRIYTLLPKIYKTENGELPTEIRKLLTEYFKPLVEKFKPLVEKYKSMSEKSQ